MSNNKKYKVNEDRLNLFETCANMPFEQAKKIDIKTGCYTSDEDIIAKQKCIQSDLKNFYGLKGLGYFDGEFNPKDIKQHFLDTLTTYKLVPLTVPKSVITKLLTNAIGNLIDFGIIQEVNINE